jgi:hypothetical protein
MNQEQQYAANINEDWQDDELIKCICLEILNFWEGLQDSFFATLRKPYNFNAIKIIVNQKELSDHGLMRAIQYLSGDRTPLLLPVFEFLDGSNASNADVKAVIDCGDDEQLKQIVCKWVFKERNYYNNDNCNSNHASYFLATCGCCGLFFAKPTNYYSNEFDVVVQCRGHQPRADKSVDTVCAAWRKNKRR